MLKKTAAKTKVFFCKIAIVAGDPVVAGTSVNLLSGFGVGFGVGLYCKDGFHILSCKMPKTLVLDSGTLFTNVLGSSGNGVPNAKQHWLQYSGRNWPQRCCVYGCSSNAVDGGHVKISGHIFSWYIVPMCASCNRYVRLYKHFGGTLYQTFFIRSRDMADMRCVGNTMAVKDNTVTIFGHIKSWEEDFKRRF